MRAHDRPFLLVNLEDSPDVRLFIEMSSHAADLLEALDALGLALKTTGDDASAADRHLIASATMAYCRTFFSSKVRAPVTDFVSIPDELSATHRLVADFRNRTIAHSQSDLSVTYAVGAVDPESREVLDVMAPNISNSMPRTQMLDFEKLCTVVLDGLDEAIEPVRARILASLRRADLTTLTRAKAPVARLLAADRFAPRTSRRAYPTSHPLYVTPVEGGRPGGQAGE